MDKNTIKTFAVESRRQMIENVKYQASLIGITAEGVSEPISKAEGMETYDYGAGTHTIFDEDIHKRESLVNEVKIKGFDNVVEEVAYTWFNRIIAIRYMEVNDYLPTRTRVLSSETLGKIEPDIITEALDLDLNYSPEDKDLIIKLKDDNKLEELFKFLFIKQCNKLNEILPRLFEKTDNWMELLLNISFTSSNDVIPDLINKIPEDDFKEQVEIIGWIYQFYNTEIKDDAFKHIKKIKISKERIPAITQLFTPDWIVKYMVENSLGKLWLEISPNSNIKKNWEYYVEEAKQDSEIEISLSKIRNESKSIKLEEIKILDPCMGSGHILVYVFDVLMQIYTSVGYSEKDATISILKNNLYGLDIDDRAYQLAYFAIMMKARSYNRKIFNEDISPLVYSIKESNKLSKRVLDYINKFNSNSELNYIINLFKNSKEYGSLINVDKCDFDGMINEINSVIESNSSNLNIISYSKELNLIKDLIIQAKILYNKYDVVITNPPYMGNKGMNSNLIDYLKSNYPNSKSDLFAVFLEKGLSLCKENGFSSMVTMQSWMFLPSYENLREFFFKNYTISNLLHMESGVMIGFGTSATIFRNTKLPMFKGTFNQIKLKDMENSKPKSFPIKENRNNIISVNNFKDIPGCPVAYWVNNHILNLFKKSDFLSNFSEPKQGLATADNKRFLRLWYELDINKIHFNSKSHEEAYSSNKKWFPILKGGKFRKWYGNQDYVVNWENDGYELKNFKNSVIRNPNFYFIPGGTWTAISNQFSVRYFPEGFLFSNAGMAIFADENILLYIIAFLNSKLSSFFLNIFNEGINFNQGNIATLPLIIDNAKLNSINELCNENIELCRLDWDYFENSWNFNKHPLLIFDNNLIENSFNEWHELTVNNYFNLQKNEEEINDIFINIYDLNNEINSNVDEESISITVADLNRDIKSFISYSIGCMFGRYSLDNEGLQFAGGNFNINNYQLFIPDDDNIIPILDTEYFEDDIVGRFVEFVKVCFGEETLEENLDYIAGALNKKGKTSREIIRNYFLKDFFNDHKKIYNKCPIYWQFDSGKQNAFKCLIYLHRYDPSIIARIRTDYLHKTQKAIEQNLAHCDNIISNSANKSEVSKATKDKSKYIKQLDEIRVYDEALRHMATQNIKIDLDDGIKVNHSKFQKVEISIEGEKPKKINLLKNI